MSKVVEHDFALEKVAESVETLAKSIESAGKTTNHKLDSIAESLGKQAVLMEKIDNLETRVSDSNSRNGQRLESLEKLSTDTIKNRDIRGCQYGRESQIKLDNLEKTVIKNLETRVVHLEDSKTWLVRVVIGKIIVIALTAIILIGKS